MKKRNRSLWRKRAVCALVALSMCIPQIAGNGRLVLAAEDVPGQSEGLQAGAGWTEVQGGQTGTEQSETQVTEQTTETFEIQTSEFSTQVSESDTRAWGTEESGTDVTESETHITEAESQTSGTEESNRAWSETQSSESGTAGSESETQMSKPGETDLSEQETETEKTTEEDPAGDGEGAWQKLRGLFGSYMVAAAENVNASDDYFVGSTVTKYSFGREELPEGFYSVKLTVLSKKDGYSNKENDLRVRLSFSVSMDEDDFLYPKSEEFLNETSFPKQGSMSDEVWMTEVNGWLKDTNKNGGIVPPLVYTYDLRALGETDIQAEKLYAAGNAQLPVGSYELENGILKVTMDPILYFMHDISLKFSLDANIDGSKLPDDPQEAVLNDKGQLIFQAVGTADGNQGGTEAPKYFVEKEAPERVTDSRITYTLSVRAAEGEVLNGKTLVDVMPSVGGDDGYKLKIVSAALKEENGKDISRIIDGADSNNDFSYTFPKLNGAGSNKITSSTVELVLELDDDSYQRLIQNGSLRQSFKNKASLTEEGKTDPLAVSEEVTTQMNVTFIGKEGREANLEGSRFAWTINAKTSLPYMESGYLVDTLCWTDHSYDMAGGVQITYQDGQTGEVNTDFLTPVRIDAGSGEAVRWESLTVDTLDTLAGAAGQQAFYYLYDAVNEKGENIPNPFYRDGSEEPQYVQRAVLVIPYTKYKGPNEDGSGREVTIKYFTDLNQHGLSSKEYIDVLEEAKKNGYTSDISNKVNLLWRNKGGIGPVPPAQDSVDFGKKVDADPGSVIKRGVSYNPKTRSIEWAVDINKLGLNLKNVVLEDNLGSSSYDLGSLKIKYYEYTNTHDNDRSGELTKLEGTPDPSSAFGYTVENGTVKVYLGDLDGDSTGTYKYYTLSFVLTLKDTSLLGNQSSDQTISNEITLSAVHGDKEYSDTSQAQIKVPNTLIEKTAVGKYDYNKHEFQWKVTVNPNKVNLTWAVVTDTLEKGFAF